jgi:anti-anti-sigma factor
VIDTFLVEVVRSGRVSRIDCVGEFDIGGGDAFVVAVRQALVVRPDMVVIDCSEVSFIDSIGMRALLHTLDLCRASNATLTIEMSPVMQRVFDTVGITELFTLAS